MGMDLRELVTASEQGLTAKCVFGEPVAQDGTVVIPVARGKLASNPAGVYVLRNGKVRWMPAVDVNRILLGFQLVAIIGIIFGTRAAMKLGPQPIPRWWRRR